jgi:hypothetical protein
MIKFVVAFALALMMGLPLTDTTPAFATDYWDWSVGSGDPAAKRRKARHRHRIHRATPAKVMSYERRADEHDHNRGGNEVKCVEKVRGLGTQWIGTSGALEAAKKDWMERVRYDHGESYLDMTNARDFESRCGRTSIGEVAGQVTYRCEIVARPCKAPLKETSAKKN